MVYPLYDSLSGSPEEISKSSVIYLIAFFVQSIHIVLTTLSVNCFHFLRKKSFNIYAKQV